jgi:hypothetical protein
LLFGSEGAAGSDAGATGSAGAALSLVAGMLVASVDGIAPAAGSAAGMLVASPTGAVPAAGSVSKLLIWSWTALVSSAVDCCPEVEVSPKGDVGVSLIGLIAGVESAAGALASLDPAA